MYKIGDKVEYCGVVSTIVAINEAQRVMSVVYKEEQEQGAVVGFDSVKPYRTAHEKLIELGWICKEIYGGKKYIAPNLEHGTFIVWDDKTFTTSDCDLELSRILTQYLEELEGE